jgi:hypothetical protein
MCDTNDTNDTNDNEIGDYCLGQDLGCDGCTDCGHSDSKGQDESQQQED